MRVNVITSNMSVIRGGTKTSTAPSSESGPSQVVAPASKSNHHLQTETKIQTEINRSLALDMSIFPRYHHIDNEKIIPIHQKQKRADPKEKLLVLVAASRWGYNSFDKEYNERIRILVAAARLVAYTNGYRHVFSIPTLLRWECNIHAQVTNGEISTVIGSSRPTGSISDTDRIENVHPGYLQYLFWLVLKRIGYNSSFHEIAYQMNLNSRIPSEKRMEINLSRRQVNK